MDDAGPGGAGGKPRRPMTWRRQVWRLGILLAGGYLVLAIMAAFFADKLMFRPGASSYADSDWADVASAGGRAGAGSGASLPATNRAGADGNLAGYDGSVRLVKLTCSDGVAITAVHLGNPLASYTILHSHGNGEDMGDMRAIYELIRQAGFNVMAYDYHGYGTSAGRPSETAAYADIDAAYDYLTGTLGLPPDRIILLGRSIGSGPAVDLATRRPVAGLVVESGFVSAFRVATRVPVLPWDKFKNLAKIGNVPCPVLVIHGTDDWVIPAWHGRKLYDAAPGRKQCLWVQGAGHNDLPGVAGDRYAQSLREFAKLVYEGKD